MYVTVWSAAVRLNVTVWPEAVPPLPDTCANPAGSVSTSVPESPYAIAATVTVTSSPVITEAGAMVLVAVGSVGWVGGGSTVTSVSPPTSRTSCSSSWTVPENV